MAGKNIKPGYNPELFKCGNLACTRGTPLSVKGYAAYPPQGVAPEIVHYIHAPGLGGFSVLCSACAHYTVVSPHPHTEARPAG